MIQGHGDDTWRYTDIRINFSSNIYAHADLSELQAHLCRNISLIGHYPEPEPHALEAMLARKHGIPADCVLVTSGATEAIYLIAQTFCQALHYYSTGSLPTFSEYADASEMFGMQRQDTALSPQIRFQVSGFRFQGARSLSPQPSAFSLQPSALSLQPSAPDRDTLLWLCNPNNPTGRTLPPADILNLCGKAAITVIDQSYEDYTLVPMLSAREAAQKPHLILVHSLTKTYAIPGLRIGYITAAPELIRLLRHHVRPWSVNALAVAAAKWLVTHDTRAIPHLNVYLAETARLRQQLNALPGIHVTNTDTNFMLATIAQTTAAALKDFLAVHHHILIRNASNFKGLTPNHFRIATQRRDENRLLVSAISQFIENFQR